MTDTPTIATPEQLDAMLTEAVVASINKMRSLVQRGTPNEALNATDRIIALANIRYE